MDGLGWKGLVDSQGKTRGDTSSGPLLVGFGLGWVVLVWGAFLFEISSFIRAWKGKNGIGIIYNQ